MNRPAAPRPDAAIEDAAARWLVRRQAGLAPADTARLDAWLAADPRHRAAFDELSGAWSALSFPRTAGRADDVRRRLAERAGARRRRLVAAGGAAAVALAALAWTWRPAPSENLPAPVVASVAARPHVQTLPDGSRVELNAGAEIAADFSGALRTVRLVRGEALFAVEKDPARPFVVTAGGVSVRAVGTAFSVRHAADGVDVLVTEGRVAVARAAETGPAPEPLLLAAGGRVEVPADPAQEPVVAATPLSADEVAAALAWRGRRVEFTRTTVAEAAALFNRQNRVQLAVADSAAGRIALSGIFWADDPEGFVRLLESGFDVRAVRTGDTITLRGR